MSAGEKVQDQATRVAVEGLADCVDDDAFDASDPPPGTRPRGGRMLVELARTLRDAGLEVREYDGWELRARSGTGLPSSGPIAIIVHHTASPPSWNGQRDVDFIAAQCDVAPMANLYLDRGGQWWVLAAGATNTNGSGGPWGPIPQDSANSRVIGIEAGNDGIGEPWPDVMQDAYVAGVAALAERYGIASDHVLGHREWAPTRKVDPAGPSRFGSVNSSHSWDMDAFRAAVEAARGGSGVRPAPTRITTDGAATYVVQPGDAWWSIADKTLGDPATTWPRLAEANGGAARILRPGDVLTIPGARPQPAPGGGGGGGEVPPFPGEAKLGDRGAVVLAWQEALIAHDVISDSEANRDQDYGDGMRKAVLALQRSWGWDDADGVAGKHTWRRLHGRD